jgi:O-antigen/teichoic acid export membrane protein
MALVNRRSATNAVLLNAAYEFGTALVQFGVQVYLARTFLVTPDDLGTASIVTWTLAALAPFSAVAVMRRVYQMPGGIEPDWRRHFLMAAAFQVACIAVLLAYAYALTSSEAHKGAPKLMALGAAGMAFDLVAQFRIASLLRTLNFRRYRFVMAWSRGAGIVALLICAHCGYGALGMVAANSVLGAVAFAIEAALSRAWRVPAPTAPDSAATIARFVGLQSLAGLIFSARGGLDSALLPGWLSKDGIGLWSRAPGLYASTAGRVQGVISDSLLPMLPHTANDPVRYRTLAIAYLDACALLAIPTSLFLVCFGPTLNLALYGPKWIDVNPLLIAGSLLPALQIFHLAIQNILFGMGRTRIQVGLACLGSALAAAALLGAWLYRTPYGYGWCLLAAEALVLGIALSQLRKAIGPGAFRTATLAPTAASLLAVAVALGIDRALAHWPLWLRVLANAACFGAVFLLALRAIFPAWLSETLSRVPKSAFLQRLLRLPAPV